MASPDSDSHAEQRANELYWGSDASVNQIADELELSKSALYGIIHPLPAGRRCPVCGGEAQFANRTAKQRDLVTCLECAWEGSSDDAALEADAEDGQPGAMRGASRRPATRRRRSDGTDAPAGARLWLGGAFLGAAAGLALVLWTRRH